jgi:nicotinamidase-related amidase
MAGDDVVTDLPTGLAAPGRTAVLCMEMQRGIVGDQAAFTGPGDAVRDSGMLDRLADLLAAAHAAGVPVVQCTVAFRADRAGSFANMPMVNQLLDNPDHLLVGTASVEVVPELAGPDDLESCRHNGIAPFGGTGLDTLLRSLGVTTVVATGVSLNRGIVGMAIEAVNLGYHVVVARDCVAGYPAEYGEAVLEHSLAAISTIVDSAALHAAWTA